MLLYALQRLRLEEWGLNARLDGRVRESHGVDENGEQITTPAATTPVATTPAATPPATTPPAAMPVEKPLEWVVQIGKMSFRVLNSALHSSLAISGRATVTAKARPIENNTKKYVIKIYWPEKARPAEWNIISEAYEAAQNDTDIIDHLPRVVTSHQFNE